MVDNGRGNTVDQPDDEVMSVRPLFFGTPRLLFVVDHFNEQCLQTLLAEEARLAKKAQLAVEARQTATNEAEDKRLPRLRERRPKC